MSSPGYAHSRAGLSQKLPAGLTAEELRRGPQWFVIGERPDGDRVVLAECYRKADAERMRGVLSKCEAYAQIVAERATEPNWSSAHA